MNDDGMNDGRSCSARLRTLVSSGQRRSIVVIDLGWDCANWTSVAGGERFTYVAHNIYGVYILANTHIHIYI